MIREPRGHGAVILSLGNRADRAEFEKYEELFFELIDRCYEADALPRDIHLARILSQAHIVGMIRSRSALIAAISIRPDGKISAIATDVSYRRNGFARALVCAGRERVGQLFVEVPLAREGMLRFTAKIGFLPATTVAKIELLLGRDASLVQRWDVSSEGIWYERASRTFGSKVRRYRLMLLADKCIE